MSAKSSIEWTDASWTPIRARVKANAGEIAAAKGYTSLVQIATKMQGHVGPHCEKVSPGCEHCYSENANSRCLPHNGTGLPFDRRSRDLVAVFLDEDILAQPLHWKKPRRIFVCSQTDLFGEFVTDEMIDRVFAVMALCPQHTFQVLTKRPERMATYFADVDRRESVEDAGSSIPGVCYANTQVGWPLPNCWLGVSVEDQPRADKRILHLLRTPAAVRFLSVEPLLGPVDLGNLAMDMSDITADLIAMRRARGEILTPESIANYPSRMWVDGLTGANASGEGLPHIDWVIVGGESGPGARPMHPDWARFIRDQCVAAGVPFFFKQWGGHGPGSVIGSTGERVFRTFPDKQTWIAKGNTWINGGVCVGADATVLKRGADFDSPGVFPVAVVHGKPKKQAGRELDGRTWDEMPEVKQ